MLSGSDFGKHSNLAVIPETVQSTGTKSEIQIIDAIVIVASTIGIRGLGKLITQVIEACRAKIATAYELELPGGEKIRISGPGVGTKHLREALRIIKENQDSRHVQLYGPDQQVIRVNALDSHQ